MVTLVEGNEVGGSFYLNDTDAIASDASAEEMEALLEATSIGDVNVTRYELKKKWSYASNKLPLLNTVC